jgi:Putative zinc-finger
MECRVVINSLSDHIDGPSLWAEESEIRSIEDHLVTCPDCQNLKLELTQLKAAARELPMHTPPRAMWTRIANLVEAELPSNSRPTRIDLPAMSWWERARAWRITLTLPRLASAAALAIVLLGVGVVFNRTTERSLQFTDAQTAILPEEPELKAEIQRRLAAIEQRKAKWTPQARADFEQHMARIEESMKLCREKLRANPTDAIHRNTLHALYAEERQLLDNVEKLKR